MSNERFTFDRVCAIQPLIFDNGIAITTQTTVDLLNNYDKLRNFDELYDFRMVYNALLFNEWHKHDEVEVYKSKRHSDGSIPFEDDSDDWFIVIAILPEGKHISNHYHMKYWDYFKIPEYKKAKDEYDGHTSDDVLNRLKELLK